MGRVVRRLGHLESIFTVGLSAIGPVIRFGWRGPCVSKVLVMVVQLASGVSASQFQVVEVAGTT